MDSSVSLKDQIWFLRVWHHIPNELYLLPNPKRTGYGRISITIMTLKEKILLNIFG